MAIDLNKLRRIRIGSGAHADRFDEKAHRELCIMEATAYVIGGQEYLDRFGYHPPCVSEAITQFLVQVNDGWTSDTKRAKLKNLIPSIVGTAPTKEESRGQAKMVSTKKTPEHRAQEKRRTAITERVMKEIQDEEWGEPAFNKLTFPQVEKIVQELIAA